MILTEETRTPPHRRRLDAFGVGRDPSWGTFDFLRETGWSALNRQGAHASAHVHPAHPEIVIRIAAEADGFARYAFLLRHRFRDEVGGHAPLVYDMALGRNGTLVALCERLREPSCDDAWLAAATTILRGCDRDGSVDCVPFKARWPRFAAFAGRLRHAAGLKTLDASRGNILVRAGGIPVINDPIPDRIGQENWGRIVDLLSAWPAMAFMDAL